MSVAEAQSWRTAMFTSNAWHATIWLLMVVVLVGCASDPIAPTTTGGIKGKVLSSQSFTPIENALVTTAPPSSSVRTSAAGYYAIDDVAPGTYVVSAQLPDSGTGSTSVSVIAGKTTTADIYLSLSPPTTGSIAGVVHDEQGAPVAGAQITTIPSLSVLRTGADGRFVFSNVSTGIYTVKATLEGTGYGEAQVQVTASATAQADIILYRQDPAMGLIVGTITMRTTGERVRGARVHLVGTNREVETNDQGSFTFSDVPPGTTYVLMEYDTWSKVYTVEVKAGSSSTLTVVIGSADPIITEGLYAYYPCDGSAEDLSGNNHQGTIVNGSFTGDRSSTSGSALLCNGSTTALIMPTSAELRQTPLTIAFWMRVDDETLSDFLLAGKYLHPSGEGWLLMIEKKEIVGAFFYDTFIGSRLDGPSMQSTVGDWTHVAYVVDATFSTIYINGLRVVSGLGVGFTRATQSSEAPRFGSLESSLTGINGLKGAIDEIYVFRRALSNDEITKLKNGN